MNIKLSEDEQAIIKKLRQLKARKQTVPPILLIRVVDGHYQLFQAVPAGLIALDSCIV